MSAFRPISPHAALRVLEEADVGVDCARLLLDLAEAGTVKGYARLVEKAILDGPSSEVRDGRIDRSIWKRLINEDKLTEVFSSGSVRLGEDGGPDGRVSVIGVRFDEKSVRAAAEQHGATRPTPKAKPKTLPAAAVSAAVPPPPSVPPTDPQRQNQARPHLADDAVSVSVSDAAAVLGLSRGTVYKLLGEGRLASVKAGARRLVSADSIRALAR